MTLNNISDPPRSHASEVSSVQPAASGKSIARPRHRRFLFGLLCALVSWVPVATAQAQQWPSGTITFVVGSNPGGPTDSLARQMAEHISSNLGTPIIIENMGGAGGQLATAKVVKSKPNGYTFLLGHTGNIAAARWLYIKPAADPLKDLEPVVRFPDIPGVVVVGKDSPYSTLADFANFVKQNPGKVNFGDAGVGSMSNLSAAMLSSRIGAKITSIPYKGNGPAMVAVVSSSIDGMIDTANTAFAQVQAGTAKALAVTSKTPMALFPGVPPVASLVPDFEATVWFGLYGPKGTPQVVKDAISAAYLKAIHEPEFQQRLKAQGMQLLDDADYAPAAFKEFTALQVEKYGKVIKEAKIEPQ